MTCLECSSPDMQPVELTDHRLMTCARCGATFMPTEDGIRELRINECPEIARDQEWRGFRRVHRSAHFWHPRRLAAG